MTRALLITALCVALTPRQGHGQSPLETGRFVWRVSAPMLDVDRCQLPEVPEHPWVSVKDPSIVRVDGQWHLFCTIRRDKQGDGRIRIGYAAFSSWSEAAEAPWSILNLTLGYHGAPQVFFFRPTQQWYLIYQAEDATRGLKYGPCYSVNEDITDPAGWTLPEPLYEVPEGTRAGLDFWVICDEAKAHLFFTTLNGTMWRAETRIEDFPNSNWSKPAVALRGDIFEASHTYKVRGEDQYLTFIEAQRGRKSRYFKAYIADRLDGEWAPLADKYDKPFVSPKNVVNQTDSWATSYSHGELVRTGHDERLEVDPASLKIVFQGASDTEYQKNDYGVIPWQLGLLEMVSAGSSGGTVE